MPETARTLILVRHAKSSWADERLSDHERPLNERGKRDAPRMARRLAERGPRPDTIISSTARRAVDTARAFASELQLPRDALVLHASIYGAGVPELVGLIRGIDESIDGIMLVGHNPAFSELRRHLTSRSLEDLPTCAVVTLEGRVRDWQHVGEGTFRLVDTDLPKGRER